MSPLQCISVRVELLPCMSKYFPAPTHIHLKALGDTCRHKMLILFYPVLKPSDAKGQKSHDPVELPIVRSHKWLDSKTQSLGRHMKAEFKLMTKIHHQNKILRFGVLHLDNIEISIS